MSTLSWLLLVISLWTVIPFIVDTYRRVENRRGRKVFLSIILQNLPDLAMVALCGFLLSQYNELNLNSFAMVVRVAMLDRLANSTALNFRAPTKSLNNFVFATMGYVLESLYITGILCISLYFQSIWGLSIYFCFGAVVSLICRLRKQVIRINFPLLVRIPDFFEISDVTFVECHYYWFNTVICFRKDDCSYDRFFLLKGNSVEQCWEVVDNSDSIGEIALSKQLDRQKTGKNYEVYYIIAVKDSSKHKYLRMGSKIPYRKF